MNTIYDREMDLFHQNLVSLKARSVNHYWNKHDRKTNSVKNKKDFDIISTFTEDMNYYFYSLLQFGYLNEDNISKVVNDFDNISYVEALSSENKRLFGLTVGQAICINPELSTFRNLSPSDFNQLIISHELGHIINRSWKRESVSFVENLYRKSRIRCILKNMGLNSSEYLKEGFEMLDEVIAQEVAEEVTYFKKNQKRPKKEYREDKEIFEHRPYLTNYNLYGEFQDVTIAFAKTLSFLNITEKDSDEVVLQKLVKAAFQNNFISLLQQEFMYDNMRLDFFVMMLAILGKMKSATYQLVGLNQKKQSVSIRPMLKTYYEIGSLNQQSQKPYVYVKR